MPETPNHGYNVPNEGEQDWHVPLNENFEQYDTDIEIRDEQANVEDYESKDGGKFLATDTGLVYLSIDDSAEAGGAEWRPRYALADYTWTGDDTEGGLSFGTANIADAAASKVGGGMENEATARRAVVAGGYQNRAEGQYSTIAGGLKNTTSGLGATVAGGQRNTAIGEGAFAAGQFAEAAHDNTFVWNDGSGESDDSGSDSPGDDFSSGTSDGASGVTGSRTFHAKSTNGVRFVTSADNSQVTYVAGGSAGWSSTSSRAVKTNVDPVDPEAVLAGVEEMSVSTWEYENDEGEGAGVRHMGPMAEDFHASFDLGTGDDNINSINADGVALAAIKGLSAKLDEKADRIDRLETAIEDREQRIGEQADRIDDLEERLTALEAQVGADAGPAPADD